MYKGKFDRDKEWPFETLTHRKGSYADRKRMERNTKLFAEWVIDLMRRTAPRLRDEERENFLTTGIRMHPSNTKYLQQFIGSWEWLNYSPVDDESVGVDEVVITEWYRLKDYYLLKQMRKKKEEN